MATKAILLYFSQCLEEEQDIFDPCILKMNKEGAVKYLPHLTYSCFIVNKLLLLFLESSSNFGLDT